MAKRNSSREEILGFLKTGRKLNALVAQREFGCVGSTLAFRVFQLRKEGWDIVTKIKTGHNGSKYAEYSLSPDWRLVENEEKRAEIKVAPKEYKIRDFKIGDMVVVSFEDGGEKVGEVVGITAEGSPMSFFEADRDFLTVDFGETFSRTTLSNVIRKGTKC